MTRGDSTEARQQPRRGRWCFNVGVVFYGSSALLVALGALVGGAATAWAASFQMRRTARLTQEHIAMTVDLQRRFVWTNELRNSLGAVTQQLGAISEVCDAVTREHTTAQNHVPSTATQTDQLTDVWRRAQGVSTVHGAFIQSTIGNDL
jgi:hypothetical protein